MCQWETERIKETFLRVKRGGKREGEKQIERERGRERERKKGCNLRERKEREQSKRHEWTLSTYI